MSHGIEPASGRDGSAQRTSGIFDIYYRFAERGEWGFKTGYYVNKANSGELAIFPLDERTFNIRPWLRFDIIFDKLYLEGLATRIQPSTTGVSRQRPQTATWSGYSWGWIGRY